MPKALLKFDLPEESEEFNTAVHGADYKSILWNIDQSLRSKIKHGDYPEEIQAAYQEIRDELHHELANYGIDIV